MPHQCTACERTFADGSKQMLSGCPDCGGNTFQYLPDDGAAPDGDPEPPARANSSGVAETVGRAATTLRDAVTPDPDAPADGAAADRSFPASPREDDQEATPPSRAEASGESAPDAESQERGHARTEPSPATSAKTDPDTGAKPAPDTVEERRDAEFIDADAADGPEDSAQTSARSEVLDDGAFPGGVVGSGAPASADADASDPDTSDASAHAAESGTADRGSAPTVDPQPSAPDDGPSGAPPTDRSAPTDPRSGPDAGSAPDAPPATDTPPATDADGRVVGTPEEDRPDLSDLREELNAQFEGIRVTEPGQYELNLMELYEREETIIALKEDGRYVIEVPEAWHGDDG
jgi:predicted  nucleic acid-binding Zn-ribbon protein